MIGDTICFKGMRAEEGPKALVQGALCSSLTVRVDVATAESK